MDNGPLTPAECKTFLNNNCFLCKHYESHVGAIVQCLASPVTGEQDVLEWKRNNTTPAEEWTCEYKTARPA